MNPTTSKKTNEREQRQTGSLGEVSSAMGTDEPGQESEMSPDNAREIVKKLRTKLIEGFTLEEAAHLIHLMKRNNVPTRPVEESGVVVEEWKPRKDKNMSELSDAVPEKKGHQKESSSEEGHEDASANSGRNRAKCNGPGRGRGRGKGKGRGQGRRRGRGKGAREDL